MRKQLVVALSVIALALPAVGCRRGKVFTAPPAAGNGVRIELMSARAKGQSLDLGLVAYNDMDQEVIVNRNQIAVVGPDGRDYYRSGGREQHTVPARGKHDVNVSVEGAALANAPGYYVRFDGVWAGPVRVDVPPMALGQPATSPGSFNSAFTAPTSKPEPQSVVAQVREAIAPSNPPPSGPRSSSVQQYQGPRRKLKNPGQKCAAIPMKVKSKDVPDEVAVIMDDVLLTELHQSGFEAIGPEDINAMIGFEKVKEAVGCDDATCVAELGNALGVEYLVAGNVAKLEGSMVLTLKLFDVRQTKVLSRANRIADGGPTTLPRLIGEAVQELVDRSGL